MAEESLADIRIAPGRLAPFLARRMVTATVSGESPLRAMDAGLLAGELVTSLADGSDPIHLVISETGRTVRVEVVTKSGADVVLDEIASTLLNRLADGWSADDGAVWFELKLVPRQELTALPEDRLFALLPGDRDARDELFDRYSLFASSIARQFRSRGRLTDDLQQVALAALVKALDRFDPSFGVKFTTFAGKTISGELRRYLRDETWPIRVPRRLKDLAVEVRQAEPALAQDLGRQPEPEEVAAALDTPTDDLLDAILAGASYRPERLDAPRVDDSLTLEGRLGQPDQAIEIAELWMSIEGALDQLPRREQKILYLRFFEDLTQAEIASIVGVSQMHVSRLLAQSLDAVRQAIDQAEGE